MCHRQIPKCFIYLIYKQIYSVLCYVEVQKIYYNNLSSKRFVFLIHRRNGNKMYTFLFCGSTTPKM